MGGVDDTDGHSHAGGDGADGLASATSGVDGGAFVVVGDRRPPADVPTGAGRRQAVPRFGDDVASPAVGQGEGDVRDDGAFPVLAGGDAAVKQAVQDDQAIQEVVLEISRDEDRFRRFAFSVPHQEQAATAASCIIAGSSQSAGALTRHARGSLRVRNRPSGEMERTRVTSGRPSIAALMISWCLLSISASDAAPTLCARSRSSDSIA